MKSLTTRMALIGCIFVRGWLDLLKLWSWICTNSTLTITIRSKWANDQTFSPLYQIPYLLSEEDSYLLLGLMIFQSNQHIIWAMTPSMQSNQPFLSLTIVLLEFGSTLGMIKWAIPKDSILKKKATKPNGGDQLLTKFRQEKLLFNLLILH